MSEASLFVFVDDETTSCVIVTACTDAKAKNMIGRALQHQSAPPLKYYTADEFATVFIAANKTRTYDMMLIGENDGEEDHEHIGTIYEIAKRDNAILVLPVDTNGDVKQQDIWTFQNHILH